ncbi:MAG: hypothetical protein M3Q44_01320 [bacterium]|nr:hypothetical protein [bacterium]
MINKVLFIAIFSLLFSFCATSAQAQLVVNEVLPGSPVPSPSMTAEPTPTQAPTAEPSPSVSPSPTTTVDPTSTPNPTPIITIPPTPTTEPSATSSAAPVIGGIQSSSPSTSPAPTTLPSPTPPLTVETILRTEPKKDKPVMQDIRTNAYNTLLDSPLAFLVSDNNQTYYHPHGLSQKSTNILLLTGFALSFSGIILMNLSKLNDFMIWRKERPSAA